MKKKIGVLLITLVMIISIGAISAADTNDTLLGAVSDTNNPLLVEASDTNIATTSVALDYEDNATSLESDAGSDVEINVNDNQDEISNQKVGTSSNVNDDLLSAAYERAFAENIGVQGSHYTNTMMVELGYRLYFAAGSDKNIKLTTKDDLELFKAYLAADADTWLK